MSDAGGSLVPGSETRYLPFGDYRSGGPSEISDRGFTGQKENMELGLYYYNARYYAPGLGRFLSADTIVPDPANPQSFNRYSYVRNNPINRIDPTGHCDTDPYDEYDDYACWVLAKQTYEKVEGAVEITLSDLESLTLEQLQSLQEDVNLLARTIENNQQTVTRLNMFWTNLNNNDLANHIDERQDAVEFATNGQMVEIQGLIGKQRARGLFEGLLGKADTPESVLSMSEVFGKTEGQIYQGAVWAFGTGGNAVVTLVEVSGIVVGGIYTFADGGVNLAWYNAIISKFDSKVESLMVENNE